MVNGYRKGWALRYLREAKAEFTAAQKTPYIASSLILEALRKAQVAIYYSLGEPAFVEGVVRQTSQKGQPVQEPILRCLVEIDRMIRQISETLDSEREKTIKQADEIIQIASDIVELFTGEKA